VSLASEATISSPPSDAIGGDGSNITTNRVFVGNAHVTVPGIYDYPAELRLVMQLALSNHGPTNPSFFDFATSVSVVSASVHTPVGIASVEALRRYTADAPLSFGLTVEEWPVAVWPSEALVASFESGTTTDLTVLVEGDAELYGEEHKSSDGGFVATTETLVGLADLPFHALTSDGTVELTVLLRTGGTTVPTIHTLDRPGYYVLDVDGSVSRSEPESLVRHWLEGGVEPVVPDAGIVSDGSIVSDGGVEQPPHDAGSPSVCVPACGSGDVCVASACVPASRQAQESCGRVPTATCDPGEDGDCAAGHACVMGLCRRLACQTQWHCSAEPTRQDGSTSGEPVAPICESDAHCAAGHACVMGVCRKLTCQTQWHCSAEPTRQDGSTSGEPVAPICESDAHCAAGHACVMGVCRKLTCQTQWHCCAEPPVQDGSTSGEPVAPVCESDAHCAAGHACVGNVCRNIMCQFQWHCGADPSTQDGSTSGEPVAPVCEADRHCAVDHRCREDGFCASTSCG
jgi:hypothetical protein